MDVFAFSTAVRESRFESRGGTTQPPCRSADGARIKAHLGLDAERCWIMVAELNRFIWPGPDVRPIRRDGEVTPYYGFLPERLFRPVLDAVIAGAEAGVLRATKRGSEGDLGLLHVSPESEQDFVAVMVISHEG